MKKLLSLLLVFSTFLGGCSYLKDSDLDLFSPADEKSIQQADASSIPDYDGSPYLALNNNEPNFTQEEKESLEPFVKFSDLDSLGRVQTAFMLAGPETLAKESRKDISRVRPTGFVQKQYEFVEGKALYNRSHLLAHSLCGENDNEKNLMTGTRYFNASSMQLFENMILDYIKETGNHVLYRVTPVFEGDNLVAKGVIMEGYSVEDHGQGISFNEFCYNVQPGVVIDYKTGESHKEDQEDNSQPIEHYILNTNTKKYHLASCPNAASIKEKNKSDYIGIPALLELQGYSPAADCIVE